MFESKFLNAAAALAAFALMSACQSGETAGPGSDEMIFDGSPQFVSMQPTVPILSVPQSRPYPGTKVAGEVAVCKDASSPAGQFHFVVSAVNAQPGDMVADTVHLSAGQCAVVYNRVNRVASGGPVTQVSITELIPQGATYILDHVLRDDDAHHALNAAGPTVTVFVNSNHGAFATFYNVAHAPNGAGTTGHHGGINTTGTGNHHGHGNR